MHLQRHMNKRKTLLHVGARKGCAKKVLNLAKRWEQLKKTPPAGLHHQDLQSDTLIHEAKTMDAKTF